MDAEKDVSNTDEYYVTALQIFDCFGADGNATLRVDKLMEKFAPFVKTNKTEYSLLKSLLDPDQMNPEISVTMLSNALTKYSENQKFKSDLEESFNLRGEALPQDSDSGISSDGFHNIEELQCELREKSRVASHLRNQLDHMDRVHEETVATLTAERDSLKAHLNILREENASLSLVRTELEEACVSRDAAAAAASDARRRLEVARARCDALEEKVAGLESEKVTLQELLCKSKAECHRINEMYLSRQTALRDHNESLRAQAAELTTRLQQREKSAQILANEKMLLELELKDLVNKSNQLPFRLDRSIDVSYTEDQMLTALDSLNSDSKFVHEFTMDESFLKTFNGDPGRPTNISLFDEIRLSFGGNMSKMRDMDSFDISNDNDLFERTNKVDKYEFVDITVQTDEFINKFRDTAVQTDYIRFVTNNSDDIEVQTEFELNEDYNKVENISKKVETQTLLIRNDVAVSPCEEIIANMKDFSRQTDSLTDPTLNAKRAIFEDTSTSKNKKTQTQNVFFFPNIIEMKDIDIQTNNDILTTSTQTDETGPYDTNNNDHNAINLEISKCVECDETKTHNNKLQRDLKRSKKVIKGLKSELNDYEENVKSLKMLFDDEKEAKVLMERALDSVTKKLETLEDACLQQQKALDSMENNAKSAEGDIDVTSVSTQAELPCVECEKREVAAEPKTLKRCFWDGCKSIFSVLSCLCFVSALLFLYQVSHYHYNARRCSGGGVAVPWRWLGLHDLIDVLFRIEYVGEVPM